MNKIINIKNKKAINQIKVFKLKRYSLIDIKFENIHLKNLNKIIHFELFNKNDLYINSATLWELMQPIGASGSHNYHGLTPEDILNSLNTLETPNYILKVKQNRYAIVPVSISSYNEPLMVIIEIGASLINKSKANINKVVTIYPKSDLEEMILKSKDDVLFENKK